MDHKDYNENTDPEDDRDDIPEEGHLVEEHEGGQRTRRKKRIKIRKRVRIKRKTSPKKKAKKVLETLAWVLIVAAFIITIIVLILQLDLNSKHRNKKSVYQPTPVPTAVTAEYHTFC